MSLLVVLLLLAATYVVAMNWACVYFSYRNAKRGIDKHHSSAPLLVQVLVGMAWLISTPGSPSWLPSTSFCIIALADISLWFLVVFALRLAFKAFRNA